MKYLALLLLGINSLSYAGDFEKLERKDLGVTYKVPQVINAQNADEAYELLRAQRQSKTYLYNKIIPSLSSVDRKGIVDTFKGKMALFKNTGDGYHDPLTGPPFECGEVKERYNSAIDVLKDLEEEILEMEQRLENLVNGDYDQPLEVELEIVNQMSIDIVNLWDTMEQVYPLSITEQTYRLEYLWQQAMNQSCSPRSNQFINPSSRQISMPGTFWDANQGGSISDYPNIDRVPYSSDGVIHFSKAITLADACLNDQRVEMRMKSTSISQPGCQVSAESDYVLTAGVERLSDNTNLTQTPDFSSVSCRDLVSDYKNWMLYPKPGRLNGVKFQLSGNKLRTKSANDPAPNPIHSTYMDGYFTILNNNLSGKSKANFSDRFTSSGFPFDKSKSDDIEILIDSNGTGKMILHTWGNANIALSSMECFKGIDGDFVRAYAFEGNGINTIHIGMHKYDAPRIFLKPLPIKLVLQTQKTN